MTGGIISQWGKGGLGGQISNADSDYLGNLQLVAKYAYGTKNVAETESGGFGRIGLIDGRVVKFATSHRDRLFVKTTDQMRASCNELRTNLLTWSEKYLAKLNEGPVKYEAAFQEKLDKIREKLGLDAEGAVRKGVGLLDRKVVASVLNELIAAYNKVDDGGNAKWDSIMSLPESTPVADEEIDEADKLRTDVTNQLKDCRLYKTLVGDYVPDESTPKPELSDVEPGTEVEAPPEAEVPLTENVEVPLTENVEVPSAEDVVPTEAPQKAEPQAVRAEPVPARPLNTLDDFVDEINEMKFTTVNYDKTTNEVTHVLKFCDADVLKQRVPSLAKLIETFINSEELNSEELELFKKELVTEIQKSIQQIYDKVRNPRIGTLYSKMEERFFEILVADALNKVGQKLTSDVVRSALFHFQEAKEDLSSEIVDKVRDLVNSRCEGMNAKTFAEMLNKISTLRLSDTPDANSMLDMLLQKCKNPKDVLLALDVLNTMGHTCSPKLTDSILEHLDELGKMSGSDLKKANKILATLN